MDNNDEKDSKSVGSTTISNERNWIKNTIPIYKIGSPLFTELEQLNISILSLADVSIVRQGSKPTVWRGE